MPRDNARVRSKAGRGAGRAAASRAADFHIYRSPVARPLLLHIPTSRVFSISPALADHLTYDGASVSAATLGATSPEVATGEVSPATQPGAAAPHSAALAELESLLRPRLSPWPAQSDSAPDATCATGSPTRDSERTDESHRASKPGAPWGDLTLFITDRCNLRCEYCFESYAPLRQAGRTISRETAGAALDFFFDRLYPAAQAYDLHLFGGEPLLAWDMVEGVTDEARRPVTLVHSETFATEALAVTRERQLKNWSPPRRRPLCGATGRFSGNSARAETKTRPCFPQATVLVTGSWPGGKLLTAE